ncbi:hypothetical protein FOZ60_005351 [Perkinsus olseni]|uniref:Uncharacterized protein n=1 Tax=Perkinsus olseni TaxID=32597 RepID=A0A7J6NR76_PEROL|nr:hypothetical protein FOZ60_005351 [Perkinsus olseni]
MADPSTSSALSLTTPISEALTFLSVSPDLAATITAACTAATAATLNDVALLGYDMLSSIVQVEDPDVSTTLALKKLVQLAKSLGSTPSSTPWTAPGTPVPAPPAAAPASSKRVAPSFSVLLGDRSTLVGLSAALHPPSTLVSDLFNQSSSDRPRLAFGYKLRDFLSSDDSASATFPDDSLRVQHLGKALLRWSTTMHLCLDLGLASLLGHTFATLDVVGSIFSGRAGGSRTAEAYHNLMMKECAAKLSADSNTACTAALTATPPTASPGSSRRSPGKGKGKGLPSRPFRPSESAPARDSSSTASPAPPSKRPKES